MRRERSEREPPDGIPVQIVSFSFERGLERQFGDWGDVCETPILIVYSWKPLLGKSRQSRFPEWQQPGGLAAFLLEAIEFAKVCLGLFDGGVGCHVNHNLSCPIVLSN
jgi:hypothetical protein